MADVAANSPFDMIVDWSLVSEAVAALKAP
jgi:hypothetical protein